jgi:predicted homoserine dehydrogenase-like protein
VSRDRPLTWDDVEVEHSTTLYRLRQEQDRLFG